jgi:hypothetical protein
MFPETKIPDMGENPNQLNNIEPEAEEKPIVYTKSEFKATVVKDHECHKVRYRSYRDAQSIINCVKHPRRYARGRKAGRRVGKKDIKPIRSYRCEICGFWHLTSQQDLRDE